MATRESDVNPAHATSSTEFTRTPVIREEHAEGMLTRLMETQAAKLPSDFFLFSALGTMVATMALELTGRQRLGRVVGLWPPVLLMMGVYNKLVKVMGTR